MRIVLFARRSHAVNLSVPNCVHNVVSRERLKHIIKTTLVHWTCHGYVKSVMHH